MNVSTIKILPVFTNVVRKLVISSFLLFMSFSSHFSFFVLVDKSYEKQKYYVIVCFLLFFIFVLPLLPCKRKTSYRKSCNLFSFLVTLSTKTKNEKWDEKLRRHQKDISKLTDLYQKNSNES